MSVRSSQSINVLFTTRAFSTGAATNADSLPTGTLYVNTVSNAAVVTVDNVATGLYSASVTLPTLAVLDVVDLRINATVSSVTDNAIIWRDSKDILLDANGGVTPSDGSITDAKFTLPTEATGTPSTFLQLVMWIAGMLGWRKVIKDSGVGTIVQYMDDGTTVKTTSTFTSTVTVDTLNEAG